MPHNESPSLTVEIIISQQRPKGNQVDKEKPTKVGSLCGPDLQLFLHRAKRNKHKIYSLTRAQTAYIRLFFLCSL